MLLPWKRASLLWKRDSAPVNKAGLSASSKMGDGVLGCVGIKEKSKWTEIMTRWRNVGAC